MSTIVENINTLVNIKRDLRQILIDNYGDPGNVFADYPSMFYDLFNVMDDKADLTNVGYQIPDLELVSTTPPPVIQVINRYVYITHPWLPGTDTKIYYSIDDSIFGPYDSNFPVYHDNLKVQAYAVYNGIQSETITEWITLQNNIYPVKPVIVRENNTVTITTETTGGTIYYEIITGTESTGYLIYSGPVTIYDWQTIGAYTAYTGNASQEVFDYATGDIPTVPADPVFARSSNTVYITCEDDNADIYYKIDSGDWTEYPETGIIIPENQTITVYAKAKKQGLESETVSQLFTYTEPAVAPATPVISFNNNTITITCGTEGAQIQYQYSGGGDSWSVYTGPVSISESKTVRARSYKNELYSENSEWYTCTYIVYPNVPSINCVDNTVFITCSTSGATIYYKIGSGSYTEYTDEFEITETVTITAKSYKDGLYSNETEPYTATYVIPEPIPDTPVIDCTQNVVTITSSAGAIIEYQYEDDEYDDIWNAYTAPFTINSDITIRARARNNNYEYSENTSWTNCFYEVPVVPATPVISYNYNTIVITCSTSGTTIEYQYYGDTNWTTYTGLININSDKVIRARAKKYNLYSDSTAWTSCIYDNDYSHQPLTFDVLNTGTFKYNGPSMMMSEDNGNTWNKITDTADIPVKSGDKLIFTTSNENSSWESTNNYFNCTFNFNVRGKLNSIGNNNSRYSYLFRGCKIISATNLVLNSPSITYNYFGLFAECTLLNAPPVIPTGIKNYCYDHMFQQCTNLISAPALPALILAEGCYGGMFTGCTSLINAPALPATEMAVQCYEEMFLGCTALNTAPALNSTVLASRCYSGMFKGCTSLVNAPTLPAIDLWFKYYVYEGMFMECTALVNAPALPATRIDEGCYQSMFKGCTSLRNIPSTLPAMTLYNYCYRSMFENCTSLTTAPELPATTLAASCYAKMFKNSSSLNYIKCLAVTNNTPTTQTEDWLYGVSVMGTFVKNANMTWWPINSVNGIPTGWTVQNAT